MPFLSPSQRVNTLKAIMDDQTNVKKHRIANHGNRSFQVGYNDIQVIQKIKTDVDIKRKI